MDLTPNYQIPLTQQKYEYWFRFHFHIQISHLFCFCSRLKYNGLHITVESQIVQIFLIAKVDNINISNDYNPLLVFDISQ